MKMKALAFAALSFIAAIMPAPARAAALECDQLSTGIGICLPRYGTDFDQWAQADINALTLLNSAAVTGSTTTKVGFGQIAVSTLTGNAGGPGIYIGSYTVVAASMTVTGGGGIAATYGVTAGNTGRLAWSSTADVAGAIDTGISRVSAGVTGVGTGAAGNKDGTVAAAGATLDANVARIDFKKSAVAKWTIFNNFDNVDSLIIYDQALGAAALKMKSNAGFIGVGTAGLPAAKLHISSGTAYLDGTAAKIETGATTAPGISACGTGATIVGSDIAGKVTIGTGGATACVVTFTTAYTNAPVCIVQNETTGNIQRPVTVGASVTINGVMVASDIVDYICIGRR